MGNGEGVKAQVTSRQAVAASNQTKASVNRYPGRVSNTASRLGQSSVPARLLGWPPREQLIQILAVAFLASVTLADLLGQNTNRWRYFIILVIFLQEIYNFPMSLCQQNTVRLGKFIGELWSPV